MHMTIKAARHDASDHYISPAQRAAGLRRIARHGNLWPEAIEELLESAVYLDKLSEVTHDIV